MLDALIEKESIAYESDTSLEAVLLGIAYFFAESEARGAYRAGPCEKACILIILQN